MRDVPVLQGQSYLFKEIISVGQPNPWSICCVSFTTVDAMKWKKLTKFKDFVKSYRERTIANHV